jgi:diacylglycerol kinase (ATP)
MSEPSGLQRGHGRFRFRGFVDAARGIKLLLLTQANARIHAVATAAVTALGVAVGLSKLEWALIICAIVAVWVTEALNTAIEFTVDLASPEQRKLAGWAKDVAAGAVLLASIGAVVIALLIFGPKLRVLLVG